MESDVQRQLLARLSDMRYNPPPTTHAKRPLKKDKLPPGASYTCSGGKEIVGVAGDAGSSNEEDNGGSDPDSPTAGPSVTSTAKRAKRSTAVESSDSSNDPSDSEESDTEESELEVESVTQSQLEAERKRISGKIVKNFEKAARVTVPVPVPVFVEELEEEASVPLATGQYIVALYAGDWYVGQILDKEVEPEAVQDDQFVFASFMERNQADLFKWPTRLDMLNTLKVRIISFLGNFVVKLLFTGTGTNNCFYLKDDILFTCKPPSLSGSTSSSRSASYSLTSAELKKAKRMFLESKAYYLTISLSFLTNIFGTGKSKPVRY